MALLSKQGGRHFHGLNVAAPNWFEPSLWLSSVGVPPPSTPFSRTVVVGFRLRKIVVPAR